MGLECGFVQRIEERGYHPLASGGTPGSHTQRGCADFGYLRFAHSQGIFCAGWKGRQPGIFQDFVFLRQREDIPNQMVLVPAEAVHQTMARFQIQPAPYNDPLNCLFLNPKVQMGCWLTLDFPTRYRDVTNS